MKKSLVVFSVIGMSGGLSGRSTPAISTAADGVLLLVVRLVCGSKCRRYLEQ